MNRLDAFQVELFGVHLVEASAGTGKTHAITTLYLRAVIERALLPSQLLVVTFTRAATSEIKNRIRARLRQALLALTGGPQVPDPSLLDYLTKLREPERAAERLRRALRNIDDAAVYTIHGFCQRALEQHAFESRTRFDQTLVESLEDLREEALNDCLLSELSRCHPVVLRRFLSNGGQARCAQLLRHVNTRPALRISPDVLPSLALDDTLASFREAQTAARAHYDFDEIFRLLSEHRGLNRNRVRKDKLDEKLALHALVLEPYAEVDVWPENCLLQQSYLETCVKKGHRAPEHPLFRACDSLFTVYQVLSSILEFEQYRVEIACVNATAALEAKRKATFAIQGFDDLLLGLRDALNTQSASGLITALRDRFPIAMIDEFQDTDPIQYSIFSKIYSTRHTTLFLIGDPKQSIYAFRGADLHAYISASASSQLQRHSLEVNWRSDPSLISAINRLYAQRENPFLFPQIRYRTMLARPNARDAQDDSGSLVSGITLSMVEAAPTSKSIRRNCAQQGARSVRQWLARNISGKPILPKDIAVLTRTNDEALSIQDALRELDIASSLTTDTSVLTAPEAAYFIALLRAVANPNDSSFVSAALLTPGFGLSPNELTHRLNEPTLWDGDSENFVRAHDMLLRHGIFAAFQYLLDAYDVVPRLLQAAGGERHVTNFYHLMEIAELQQSQRDLLPLALLRFIVKLRQDPTEIAAEARQLRIESDEHAVTITTVHRSKGLEYPIVICPYLWSDSSRPLTKNDILLYHDDRSSSWVADLRGKHADPDARTAAELESTAEHHRLIYVALTRARHAVTVLVPPFKEPEKNPLCRVLWPALGNPQARASTDSTTNCASIRIEPVPENTGDPSAAPQHRHEPLEWRPLIRHISQRWSTSSFSALVAGQPAHTLNHFDEQGRDIDADATAMHGESPALSSARFEAMPPGAETGDILHKILETVDFTAFNPHSDLVTEPLLNRLGTEVQKDSARIKGDLAAVLNAPLLRDDPTFNLRQIDEKHRRSELQFSMGVGWSTQAAPMRALSSRHLATVLTPEATGLDDSYAKSVEQLGFDSLAGYLRGFIDLVFEYKGRTYVVDYKSTSISHTIEGFTPERVRQTVAANHYALQTAIYALVMHRHMRWRKPDYDFERDFGGTLVVFLRGLCPDRPPGHSVFFHRATRSAIDALDAAFGAPEAP